MGRFDGRVAVVTGAAGQIGAACARALAGEGADVAAADLTAPAIEVSGGGRVEANRRGPERPGGPRARLRGGRGGARPGRRPRAERGGPRTRPVPRDRRGEHRPRPRDQRPRDPPRRAPRGGVDGGARGAGRDRQPHLGLGRRVRRGVDRLRGLEGGGDDGDAEHGRRAGAARDPRRRRRPGVHGEVPGAPAPRPASTSTTTSGGASRCAGSGARTTSRSRCSSSPRTPRRTSAGRCSMSTVEALPPGSGLGSRHG